ncbi:MAG: acyl-CoA carboxylase subunit epsilon [Beutenbergiaceae bacterium]
MSAADEAARVGEFGDLSGLVKVVRGNVGDEELAALVASIVAARAASLGEEIDDGSNSSVWGDPRRRWGVAPKASRAAWRWSTHQAW